MHRFRKRFVKPKQYGKRIRLLSSLEPNESLPHNLNDSITETNDQDSSSDDNNSSTFENVNTNSNSQDISTESSDTCDTDTSSFYFSDNDSQFTNGNLDSLSNTEPCHSQNSFNDVVAQNSSIINDQTLPPFQEALKEWALECRPNISHVDKLLKIINNYPMFGSLPKTYETLVQTPRNIQIRSVPPGKYFHLGVKYAVSSIIDYYSPILLEGTLQLDLNIDGIPIYSSSKTQFWPILGQIKNIKGSSPFLIGIYCGKKKPNCVKQYLEDLIIDLKDMQENFLEYKDKFYKIKLRAVICDAPARSYVKCVKGHNGYSSCNFCIQEGVFDKSRMYFPETNATLRTDTSFRNKIHEDHHLEEGDIISPFEELDIDMIHAFPLDYMHLLLLGVMKKLLLIWLSGDLRVRMNGNNILLLNNLLDKISDTQSRIFSRPSRSIDDLKYWKSTEFRTFLLYTGPVVLKTILSPELYSNFLNLHIATKICIRNEFEPHLDIAHQLYLDFVASFEECYGAHLISSNVHNVVHLVECVKRFGVLDNFSAFPFESALGRVKFLIKKNQQELQQVAKRIIENRGILIRGKKLLEDETILKKETFPNSKKFAVLNIGEIKYSNDDKDGWFLSRSGKIVKICYFKNTDGIIMIHGDEISTILANIYKRPIESMFFDIYTTDTFQKQPKVFSITDIQMKIFYFSLKESDSSNIKYYFMGL